MHPGYLLEMTELDDGIKKEPRSGRKHIELWVGLASFDYKSEPRM